MQRLEARRGVEEQHFLARRARSHSYNPPVDLRLVDYVSSYDPNLMCPICRCPFVDPVVLAECGHCFCRECIRQSWNTQTTTYTPHGPHGDCPSCRTPARLRPRSTTNNILINMTDELIVRCPKSDEGCKAEVKRGEVQDHVNIYCGFTLVECGADHCELPVRRKDVAQGCLHYGVSCLSCRKELDKCNLDCHWRNDCPARQTECAVCKSMVFPRDLAEHSSTACAAISVPCPGAALGCSNRSTGAQARTHADTCMLAKLAPILTTQHERLEEQEAAQKQMSRKLEVLEDGFTTIQSILSPFSSDNMVDKLGTDPAPGPRPTDLPGPYSADFDLDAPASFSAPNTSAGPYASPLHHLLHMHESLRDEISRISSALSELDGRHSMQNLNENLRTREEISYIGAQLGGLQRQVHWLTSAQLHRQQAGRSPTPGSATSAGTAITDATSGAGVEAALGAVNTAATALRGAARMVNVGGREASGMRRGASEEGRTKL
ncbi:hypothetical protein BDY17DRAFT_250896 [Neohortaea acidophila]|uniref:RING-type domain-containing protein n=1 Tax=Neohortaea acidophila TaxID=245834 RepID=A0A6A6PSE7_9PEZI|nr:uncharacterized protein BDY17DRAFT_250896 [Neohortaea acidophila]KAF2483019.1 hypothetical protein BDY17DRAFT_250896 [Neohortaea acidophila]